MPLTLLCNSPGIELLERILAATFVIRAHPFYKSDMSPEHILRRQAIHDRAKLRMDVFRHTACTSMSRVVFVPSSLPLPFYSNVKWTTETLPFVRCRSF
jgi:hypothetical protein